MHVLPTLTYNRFYLKNAGILNIMPNIFSLCDTEVFTCIILIILKNVEGFSHHLKIRQYAVQNVNYLQMSLPSTMI